MAMFRSGFSYEAIAREHRLTSTRIRQIVAASLQTANSTTRIDRMRVQAARLESALRIATRGVETGKFGAIGSLLKALDRLDKYLAVAEAPQARDGAARERLLAKLDRAASRLSRPKMGASRPPPPEQTAPADAGAKFSSSQPLENSRNRVGISTSAGAGAPPAQIARTAAKTSSA